MNWVSIVCFGICAALLLSFGWRKTDILSPARLFGFVWCLSMGLTELKFSALQHLWTIESWVLLLLGVGAFLLGTFIPYVVYVQTPLLSVKEIRERLKGQQVREKRLFWLILTCVIVYSTAYITNYLVRGWLPVDVIGTAISRVDFNVSGLTLFLYIASIIMLFTFLYFVLVNGHKTKKSFLALLLVLTGGSFFLLLMRFPIIMVAVVSFTLLYYATSFIRFRTAVPLFIAVAAFFYWISSLRFATVVSTYLYSVSKMRFSKEYAFLTEPYMYVVTNLENFARSVDKGEYHTYGYFTLDFVTAISGLKYWVLDYFNFERTPYLTSNYNTYTAFYWFYSDFGVVGLGLIPFVLGVATGLLYFRVRTVPTIANVMLYGFAVFCIFISYFNFPLAFLWFELNLLGVFLFLRWTLLPRVHPVHSGLEAV